MPGTRIIYGGVAAAAVLAMAAALAPRIYHGRMHGIEEPVSPVSGGEQRRAPQTQPARAPQAQPARAPQARPAEAAPPAASAPPAADSAAALAPLASGSLAEMELPAVRLPEVQPRDVAPPAPSEPRFEFYTLLPDTPAAARRGPSIAQPAPSRARPGRDLAPSQQAPVARANRDSFAGAQPNRVHLVSETPVSTFSIDVDTASYAFVRRQLNAGRLPDPRAVRVEEMINYFDYDYPPPPSADPPFRATVAVYPSPWSRGAKLMHVGIKGYTVEDASKPRSNLVFLIDTSGSMRGADRLPLLKSALALLVDSLDAADTVAIVTYAAGVRVALQPTPAAERARILAALDGLQAEGRTAGAAGIQEAYRLAEAASSAGAVSRVILATDGDFNVGMSDPRALTEFVARKRESGIFLSVLGFGQGNYHDDVMQALAQNGNGNAAYVDTLREARKVLVEEAGSTLLPIASDVKIQVEFNPARVAEYRLVGYETRRLRREDFNDDRVDAGDIGSGHAVTAIYEFREPGSATRAIDESRYQERPAARGSDARGDEYAFLKIRYKLPGAAESRLVTDPITADDERSGVAQLDPDLRFAAAVAAFAQRLRGELDARDFSYDDIAALAGGARGRDTFGYRAEFIDLVRLAKGMRGR